MAKTAIWSAHYGKKQQFALRIMAKAAIWSAHHGKKQRRT
jgi:hypothetical protein